MFNNKTKKFALEEHKTALIKYEVSQKELNKQCESLYEERKNAVETISNIRDVINSIANTPKDFDVKMGEVNSELKIFKETEVYANEAYEEAVKAGINMGTGAAVGIGIATMTPNILMSIATTYGVASTGTLISSLSGAAAQKAAVAWIGRTFAGFAVKSGAGMVAGKAFLALSGPIGWSISAASGAVSLWLMSNKNKKFADEVMEEAKNIYIAEECARETIGTISTLKEKTNLLRTDLNNDMNKILSYKNTNYDSLQVEDKYYLGTLVNNTQTLSALLNQTIE